MHMHTMLVLPGGALPSDWCVWQWRYILILAGAIQPTEAGISERGRHYLEHHGTLIFLTFSSVFELLS